MSAFLITFYDTGRRGVVEESAESDTTLRDQIVFYLHERKLKMSIVIEEIIFFLRYRDRQKVRLHGV